MTTSEAAPPWGSIVAAIGGGAGAAAIGWLVVDQQLLTAPAAGFGLALGGTALALVTNGAARALAASIAAVGIGRVAVDLIEKRTQRAAGQELEQTGGAATVPMKEDVARDHAHRDAMPRNDWRSEVKVTESAAGKVSFTGWQTYDDLYLAQWSYFGRVRGAERIGQDTVPRTTNGDVLQLVDVWQAATDEHEGSGRLPGMVNWDAAIAKWNVASAMALRDAAEHDLRATYAYNAELWDALVDLSEQLTIGTHAPTNTQRFADAAKRAIAELPKKVADAARAVGHGAARIAKDVAGAVGGAGAALLAPMFAPLKWPLLVGGGVVALFLINRSSTHSEEAP